MLRLLMLFTLIGLAATQSILGSGGPPVYVPTAELHLGIGDSYEKGPYPFHKLFTTSAIRAYQILISPSKGTSCPMYPNCSFYGYETFQHHNPLTAFMMTSDRLHRCGHDLNMYEPIVVDGFIRFYDPIMVSEDEFVSGDEAGSLESEDQARRNVASHVSASPVLPDTQVFGSDSLLFGFAESLRADGDLDRAITEYRRLLFYYPQSQLWAATAISLLHCYTLSEEYLDAAHWGQSLVERNRDQVDTGYVKFVIGSSYFQLDNFPMARTYLSGVVSSSQNLVEQKSEMLRGLAFANEYMWTEAESTFAGVSQDSRYADQSRTSAALCREGRKLSMKSPTLAGFLAIVPGLGYLYDGYRQTAFSSLTVNSLFAWGMIEAFQDDKSGLGVMLAVLSFGWYSGNIYGSVISARRRNTKRKEDLLAEFNLGFRF